MRKSAGIVTLALAAACAVLAGCASPGQQMTERAESQIKSLHQARGKQYRQTPPFKVVHQRWLGGGQTVAVNNTHSLPAHYANQKETIHASQAQTLRWYAGWLAAHGGLRVSFGLGVNTKEQAVKKSLNYTGDYKGLLNALCLVYGLHWRLDDAGGVSLYRFVTHSFTLASIIGQSEAGAKISGGSGKGVGVGGGGGGVRGGARQTTIQTQMKQSAGFKASLKPWDKVVKNIKLMLSPDGSASANQAAGLVTVTDTPEVVRTVASYVNAVNSQLGRQVAIIAHVYTLQLDSTHYQNFSVDALFHTFGNAFSIATGHPTNISAPAGAGGLTASILKDASGALGHFTGTEVFINALRQFGRVSIVTSGSGIAMNNQVLPISNASTQTYLASMQTFAFSGAQVGSQSTLTPGQITTGFTMEAIPHILGGNKVALRLSVKLSSLNSIKTIKVGNAKTGVSEIQAPNWTTRSYMPTVVVPSGAMVVLAGYAKGNGSNKHGAGIFGYANNDQTSRTVVVITVSVREIPGVSTKRLASF